MIALQLFLAVFAFFMMYVLRIHYRKHNISALEFGAWLVIWIGFLFFSFFPSTLADIADTLYIGRVFDLLTLIGLVLLAIIVVFTRLEVKALLHKLETFSRDSAITTKKKQE